MGTLIKEMIKKEKQTYTFKERCTGVAGFCPDCESIVSWNSYHNRFQCMSNDCCFETNEKGERIWDNSMRQENLKRLKAESDRNIQLNLN